MASGPNQLNLAIEYVVYGFLSCTANLCQYDKTDLAALSRNRLNSAIQLAGTLNYTIESADFFHLNKTQ